MKILEQKNTLSEINKLLNRLNSIMDVAKGKVSELE